MTEDHSVQPDDGEEQGEQYEHHRITADPGQQPLRVDRFLNNLLANVSRSKVQTAADAGQVLVNDEPVRRNYKVRGGDTVTVVFSYPPREHVLIPEDIPLNIVHEDEAVVVVHKKPGMVVHPGVGNPRGTMANALMHHFGVLPGQQPQRPGLVHRLDKDTSGIMVVAKNEHALSDLTQQFFRRSTQRTYWALVWGNPKEDSGTVTGHIGRSLQNRKLFQVYPDGEHGKHAVTHYRVLERLGYVSLVECRLETGRTHQIRVHLKYIGHPVFNDRDYGGDKILKGTTFTKYRQFVQNCFAACPRQALHAKTLGFHHPDSGEQLFFDSELPDDMTALLDKWRNYSHHRGE